MLFNYDWWFDGAYEQRVTEAKRRCAVSHFPELKTESVPSNGRLEAFLAQLEARTIIYLRDGFSYEVKEIIKHPNTASLTFECMPADEAYKVGCFVVTLPFEDIVRIEVFAVHPDEKPEDMPSIKGFGGAQGPPARPDERPVRRDPPDRD